MITWYEHRLAETTQICIGADLGITVTAPDETAVLTDVHHLAFVSRAASRLRELAEIGVARQVT
jgi:hypothetical protein